MGSCECFNDRRSVGGLPGIFSRNIDEESQMYSESK